MNKSLMRRGLSFALALVLGLSALPVFALAAQEDGLCEHHPVHTETCGFEEMGICGHICSNDNGCITISCAHVHVESCYNAHGLKCKHNCTDNEACYTPITNCLHTQHGGCGHADGKDCDFAVNGCPDCKNEGKLTQIKGTDVTIAGYNFPYTGEEICPAVTVKVGNTLLTEGTHYTVSYENNIGVGAASVTVTGLAEGGYKGIVTIAFTIAQEPGTPEFTLVEIKGTDVTIDGTSFPYTGEAIEPAITVNVAGQALVEDKDYSVTYENNVEPGTASVTVKGIATASETVGYTGEVTIEFTITEAQDETPEESKPEDETPEESKPEDETPEESKPEDETPEESKPEDETPEESKPEDETPEESKPEDETPEESKPEDETPEESKPEDETPGESKPEDETPEESKPEEAKPVSYKITSGNGKKWYQNSGKQLSFTINAESDDFTGVVINGKKLDASHYTVKNDTTVTLKTSYLNKLTVDKYNIVFQFVDGEAKGTFTVSDQYDDTNPTTGDQIGMVMTVMLASLAALGGCVVLYRKRFSK